MKLFCLIGLHGWQYIHAPQVIPGLMRRICLNCGRTDYHPNNETSK